MTNNASEVGKSVTTQSSLDAVTTVVGKAKNFTSSFKDQVESPMDLTSLGVEKFLKNIPLFYIFTIIAGVAALVLIILFLLISCY